MKHLSILGLFLSLFFITTNSYSQSNTFPATGNVGIGTISPILGLDIQRGQSEAITSLSNVPNGSLWIGSNQTSGGLSIGQYSGSYSWLQSRNISGTGSAYPIVINPLGGNVGIGTVTPNAKATIQMTGDGTGLSVRSSYSANANIFSVEQSSSDGFVYVNSATGLPNAKISGYYASSSYFAANGGNVGIGTTSPNAKLEVVGSSGITGFTGTSFLGLLVRGSNNSGTDISGIDFSGYSSDYYNRPLARIGIKPTSAGSYLLFGTSNSYVSGITNTAMSIDYIGNVGVGTSIPTNRLEVKVASGNGSDVTQGVAINDGGSQNKMQLFFGVNTAGSYSWIQSALTGVSNKYLVLNPDGGNVLIGKSTQVNSVYKLDVAGKIRADEVVVNTTGADFVFAKDYRLPSLYEVELFIKKNKHLPGISTASEMKENGMNMSEMQTKLLQKIEELTLYVIELKKDNESLVRRLNKLEN